MRDHLLGCAQFIPDVENERVMPSLTKAKPYALGIPKRVHAENAAKYARWDAANATKEFEDHDHTPAGMMADFPREYDLKTMLGEAADRRDAVTGDWGSWGKSLYDLMQEYDEQVQRQCGINDMVLNANKQTLKVDTYQTSAEIKDFYKRAALSKVEDWERKVFEARLTLKKPVHVGVDLGKPGGDMSAVAVRHGSEMEYPVAWDSLFSSK